MIPTMKKRGEWLKERREELKALDKKRFSVRALAERIGITSAGVSHLENSDAMPALDLAIKLARELDRPIEWVLTGTGNYKQIGIPIIGTTLTGPNTDWIEKRGQGISTLEFVDIKVPTRSLYGLKVTGDNSLDRYNEGDVLIADPDAQPVTGEEVIVITKDGDGPYIKVLANQHGNQVMLESVDRKQRVIRDLDEIILIHPIIFVAKYHTVRAGS